MRPARNADESLSAITCSEISEEVIAWQQRPLEDVYPIIYFDALVVKVRQDKQVIKKHLYLALAINLQGDVARDFKVIYQAATVEKAEQALSDFSKKWDDKYPMISQSWWRHWDNLTPFFGFPPEIRKVIYTYTKVTCKSHD